jgi:tRNA A37 threonylcarbamoyladenosine dehydratase
VNLLHERFDSDTAETVLRTQFSAVIDATDQLQQKCLLIAECKERSIPVVVAGGSAGKLDPTQIRIDDLAFSQVIACCKRPEKNFGPILVFQKT